jgi:hypothetical protein
MKTTLLLIALALCSGCVSKRAYRLPPISADEISVTHTDWFGSIKASGSGVKITEAYLTWAEARWEITYGGWSDIVIAKNYRQRRVKTDDSAEPKEKDTP